jgi:hypothetical protein
VVSFATFGSDSSLLYFDPSFYFSHIKQQRHCAVLASGVPGTEFISSIDSRIVVRMRSLEGLLDAKGKPGKIDVLLKGGEQPLREFNKNDLREGSISKCYVLTAPGDIISVDITADANTADVFDLEVDGILRASVSSKALAKTFHGTINKVCFKAKPGSKRDAAKYCGMKVRRRDGSMGKSSDLFTLGINRKLMTSRCDLQSIRTSFGCKQPRHQGMAEEFNGG